MVSCTIMRWTSKIAANSGGAVFIADSANNRVRMVTSGVISTVVGTGTASSTGDGSSATLATLNSPYGVAIDGAGYVLIAEYSGSRVRRFPVGGNIATFAGTGTSGYSGDGGPASSAKMQEPATSVYDPVSGGVYITDASDCRVRFEAANGTMSTVAGTGTCGNTGNGGAALSAKINPAGACVDALGNVYIADDSDAVIRVLQVPTPTPSSTPTSTATTTRTPPAFGGVGGSWLASTLAGSGSGTGSGEAATSALLGEPICVAVYSGITVLADYTMNAVRVVWANGTIGLLAGTGAASSTGDGGQATAATLNGPAGVAFSPDGTVIYASEFTGARIRRVVLATGVITTYAGTGTASYSGDGAAATSATLSNPYALATDTTGVWVLHE